MGQLTKSQDRKLSGVAGGMAEYFQMDKTIVRAICLLGCIVMPPLLLAYFVLAMVMPNSAGPSRPDAGQAGAAGWAAAGAQSGRRRLTKSYDRWISGVAGGIAKRYDIDPLLIRGLFLVAFFGFGTGLLAYIVLAIVMPRPEAA